MRTGRLAELERWVHEGLAFTRERGFWSHAYNLEVHRCLLLMRHGDWDGAEDGLRRLVDTVADPGMLYAYSVPWLGRLLARRGDPGAGPMLAAAWVQARRQRLLLGLAYAGIARVEWAWLAGRPDVARQVAAVLEPRLAHPGAAPFRGELMRHLARAGLPAEPFPGCPPAYAAGLRGDWEAAAGLWRVDRRPLRDGARARRVRRPGRAGRGAGHVRDARRRPRRGAGARPAQGGGRPRAARSARDARARTPPG